MSGPSGLPCRRFMWRVGAHSLLQMSGLSFSAKSNVHREKPQCLAL